MSRSAAFKSFYAILEANAPLVQALGHTMGATTVEAGARIVADYARLQELPVPCVLMTLAPELPTRTREEAAHQVALQVYGRDVFEASDLTDRLEAALNARMGGYRNTGEISMPLRLSKVEFGLPQPVPLDQLRADGIGHQIIVTLYWVKV
jgi:hypothetical protein